MIQLFKPNATQNHFATKSAFSTPLGIIGHKGCGKTTVGVAYAKKQGLSFIDTDQCLQQRYGKDGETLMALYARLGQVKFRKLEAKLILDLSINEPTVIATGGGSVLQTGNIDRLKQLGKLIYLHVDSAVLYKRWQSLEQCLLDINDPLAWQQYYDSRHLLYKKNADIIIDTTNKTVDEIVHLVGQSYGK